ncbi:MAG: hypothetical protein R2755_28100 [Acidimicrobiales bacterium]
MISLAIVGAGVMGSNHARIAAVRPNVRITNIVDPDHTAEVLAAHVGATAASSIEHLDPLPTRRRGHTEPSPSGHR